MSKPNEVIAGERLLSLIATPVDLNPVLEAIDGLNGAEILTRLEAIAGNDVDLQPVLDALSALNVDVDLSPILDALGDVGTTPDLTPVLDALTDLSGDIDLAAITQALSVLDARAGEIIQVTTDHSDSWSSFVNTLATGEIID